jgi:glycosyltransferase involved in cell wall biosynthesis
MTNIAFLFTGIGNLSGGGGAERFFADFFEKYQGASPLCNLFFISDKESLKNLKNIGLLKEQKNVLTYKIVSNRFKDKIDAIQLIKIIVLNRIKLIQIPLYHIQYYPLIKTIDNLPKFIRPKIVLTITDSFIPHYYFDDRERGYNFQKILGGLFENIKIDSVISWYQLFKDFAEKNKLIKCDPKIFCISSRYSGKTFDLSKPKKDQIVFASRLTIAKRPLMFVEAINILKQKNPEINNWKFFIYGKGNLEEEIREKINNYGLKDIVELTHHHDLTKVFEESKCFVSTQDYENFPSLSMNEAMAAGNAIISRNVGQTDLFVKDMVNGILLKQDDEKGLADALNYFINHRELHEKMAIASLRFTENIHTFLNFKIQMENFWMKTLIIN